MNTRAPSAAEPAAQCVIAAFQRQFPGRIRAAYILGSHADQTATPTSDLDLTLIFAGEFASQEERAEAQRLVRVCAENPPIELDIEIEDEVALAGGLSPNLKFASALIFGDDIRDQFPLVPLKEWTRDRMHSSWWRVARLFARPSPLGLLLDYPEPSAEFLGYTRRTLRLADGREVPCTRDLIRLTGWAATGLLALDCGVYVPSKREAHILYATHIGDEWAHLINDVYALCRTRWNYLIPVETSERAQLRALCEQTSRFERHFVARYLPFLLSELRGHPIGAHAACDVMLHAPLDVPEVQRDLARLAAAGGAVGDLASHALTAYTPDGETR